MAAQPLFLSMGKSAIYCGGAGSGSVSCILELSIFKLFSAEMLLMLASFKIHSKLLGYLVKKESKNSCIIILYVKLGNWVTLVPLISKLGLSLKDFGLRDKSVHGSNSYIRTYFVCYCENQKIIPNDCDIFRTNKFVLLLHRFFRTSFLMIFFIILFKMNNLIWNSFFVYIDVILAVDPLMPVN